MTLDEYKKCIARLEKEFVSKKRELYKKFALSNATHKIGDFVSDASCTIKIERISWYIGIEGVPGVKYIGPRYTKDRNRPVKSGETGCVFVRTYI